MAQNKLYIGIEKNNAFDALRYFFAFSLIAVHFCTLTGIEQFWPVAGGTRVKAFFIISGFLVYNSFLYNENIKTYAVKRIRRIYPAYLGVILFSVIVGFFITSMPVAEYVHSGQTWKYLFSNLLFLNVIEPSLPGVFEGSVENSVNGALWSMKVEVAFYFILPLIAWIVRRYWRYRGFVLLSLISFSVLYELGCDWMYENTQNTLWVSLGHQYGMYQMYFCAGMLILVYYQWFMKYIYPITVIGGLIYFSQFVFPFVRWIDCFSFSAFIIGLAFLLKRLAFLRKYDNISYGLYLYHCPVIQILVHFNLHRWSIIGMFLLTLAITIMLSVISWYVIEKPLLYKKK